MLRAWTAASHGPRCCTQRPGAGDRLDAGHRAPGGAVQEGVPGGIVSGGTVDDDAHLLHGWEKTLKGRSPRRQSGAVMRPGFGSYREQGHEASFKAGQRCRHVMDGAIARYRIERATQRLDGGCAVPRCTCNERLPVGNRLQALRAPLWRIRFWTTEVAWTGAPLLGCVLESQPPKGTARCRPRRGERLPLCGTRDGFNTGLGPQGATATWVSALPAYSRLLCTQHWRAAHLDAAPWKRDGLLCENSPSGFSPSSRMAAGGDHTSGFSPLGLLPISLRDSGSREAHDCQGLCGRGKRDPVMFRPPGSLLPKHLARRHQIAPAGRADICGRRLHDPTSVFRMAA